MTYGQTFPDWMQYVTYCRLLLKHELSSSLCSVSDFMQQKSVWVDCCCVNHTYATSHKNRPSSIQQTTMNRSPHADFSGCVKLLIERLRTWGNVHWSCTMFSLGRDRDYRYTEQRLTVLGCARMWRFSSLDTYGTMLGNKCSAFHGFFKVFVKCLLVQIQS